MTLCAIGSALRSGQRDVQQGVLCARVAERLIAQLLRTAPGFARIMMVDMMNMYMCATLGS